MRWMDRDEDIGAAIVGIAFIIVMLLAMTVVYLHLYAAH